MYRLGEELKKHLPQIKTPSLILHAKEDDLSHPRNAQIIDKNIAAQHELHIIEDSYHMLHVDAQHKKVIALTADFFEKFNA
jgi:carboxylesterase